MISKYGKKFIITEQNVDVFIDKMSAFVANTVKSANMQGAVLGMSGGIDCSVCARLCQKANIPVLLVMMPDGTDMELSKSAAHAMELITKFNFDYQQINIKSVCSEIERVSGGDLLTKLSKSNIRPRTRTMILYSIAQTQQRLVMGTSNLSERLLGYFTKWGDGASDFNPLAMLTKGEVRLVAKALMIPEVIINKPPSAGLFEGQTDEADFGFTYKQIDSYILSGTSGDMDVDKRIQARITSSAHKLAPIRIFTD